MFSILKPYIFSLDPEAAHDLAIKSLKFNVLPKSFFNVEEEEMLETNYLEKSYQTRLDWQLVLIRARRFITHYLN